MPVLRTYTVVLEHNEDGGYTVSAPSLKGCITQGHTIAEALLRVQEAITCHLESLADLRLPIPEDCKNIQINVDTLDEAMVMKVNVSVSAEGEIAVL